MKQNPWKVIDQICVKNGFSLKEVREIRKNLKAILAERYPFGPNEGGYNKPLDSLFFWAGTPQGHDYWSDIAGRLGIHGYGKR